MPYLFIVDIVVINIDNTLIVYLNTLLSRKNGNVDTHVFKNEAIIKNNVKKCNPNK